MTYNLSVMVEVNKKKEADKKRREYQKVRVKENLRLVLNDPESLFAQEEGEVLW